MNAPYVLGTNPKYFKWKWADLVTIDFLVSRGGENAKQGLALEVGVKAKDVLRSVRYQVESYVWCAALFVHSALE